MKHAVCPVCKIEDDYSEIFPIPDYMLVKCDKCSMVWDSSDTSIVTYEESYYSGDSLKGGYTDYINSMAINKLTFRKRLETLDGYVVKKDIVLDIGCALGDCLLEAKQMGWVNTVGLEISEYAYNYCLSRGLEAHLGYLQNVKLPDNHFDLIMSQDVIEHDATPETSLKEIHRILKSGGILFIVTPNIASTWEKILGRYWYHYKPGEHIMYFSPKNITKILESAKFSNIIVKRALHVMSLGYILERLTFYAPILFRTLSKFSKALRIDQLPITVYTGEMEVFATKQ